MDFGFYFQQNFSALRKKTSLLLYWTIIVFCSLALAWQLTTSMETYLASPTGSSISFSSIDQLNMSITMCKVQKGNYRQLISNNISYEKSKGSTDKMIWHQINEDNQTDKFLWYSDLMYQCMSVSLKGRQIKIERSKNNDNFLFLHQTGHFASGFEQKIPSSRQIFIAEYLVNADQFDIGDTPINCDLQGKFTSCKLHYLAQQVNSTLGCISKFMW